MSPAAYRPHWKGDTIVGPSPTPRPRKIARLLPNELEGRNFYTGNRTPPSLQQAKASNASSSSGRRQAQSLFFFTLEHSRMETSERPGQSARSTF
jgi:hypothetical protein